MDKKRSNNEIEIEFKVFNFKKETCIDFYFYRLEVMELKEIES